MREDSAIKAVIRNVIGDKFWAVEDLREYEIVKQTNTTLYACTFSGSTSNIIDISKEVSPESFAENFKATYVEALEQKIVFTEQDIGCDRSLLKKLLKEI